MSAEFKITRDELTALAGKCGYEVDYEITDAVAVWIASDRHWVHFDPHESRDDAAHMEDAIEKAGLWRKYKDEIWKMIFDQTGEQDDFTDFLLRLSPAQRTEAALRAFGIRREA